LVSHKGDFILTRRKGNRYSALLAGLAWLILLTAVFVAGGCQERPVTESKPPPSFKLGSDRLFEPEYFSLVWGRRIGLISNHTGVDSGLVHISARLDQAEEVELVALFGPEHGFSGNFQAGQVVAESPRIYSLYGEHRAPTDDMLSGVDVLVYDIQDVGVRFYTYISTLFESMKAAARNKIPVVVLDRPNPLGGLRVEGPVIEKEFFSFVGIYSIPIRYGMTVGELARFFNREAGISADLHVVPMQGWSRESGFPEGQIKWIAPSPNMPSLRTARMYPGFCLIEGTNLSEGRGTTLPFELVGAPWLDAGHLAQVLNSERIPGTFYRPQQFTPWFSKYREQNCSGLQIHVTDPDTFRPIRSALRLISEALKMHPAEFEFRVRSFDRLIGNNWVRERLLKGQSVESIRKEWIPGTEEFQRRREAYFLY